MITFVNSFYLLKRLSVVHEKTNIIIMNEAGNTLSILSNPVHPRIRIPGGRYNLYSDP